MESEQMQVATKEEKGTTSDFPVVLFCFFMGFILRAGCTWGP